ncbi:MAG TPA: cold shock domain-containing protein [Candidatus Cloacimonadota bacterium]|nr:cold shock domain-containing protein [Candidatus Cloacimonadota bacterium]
MKGNVKWFNDTKGYGFIQNSDGKQFFVHWKAITTSENGRKFLLDGEAVEFDVVSSNKGDQAINVVRLSLNR